MIRKSLAFLLIGFVLAIAGDAQTPAPGTQGETKAFSMFFDPDGGYLGIQTEEVTKANFAKYGLPEVRGVAIEKVVDGSPAEKAGLQNGDVIVRLNNEEVTSVRKLTRLLGEISPDHEIKLTVVRSGAEREVVATLGKRPMPIFEDGAFAMGVPRLERVPLPPAGDFPPLPRVEGVPRVEPFPRGSSEPFTLRSSPRRTIGISVSSLTKQLSEHFGVAGGVLINEVRTGSPAAKAGLKAGDIIVEVDGKEVKAEIDVIRAIVEKKEGDVSLTFVRDRNRQTVRVVPEERPETGMFHYAYPNIPENKSPWRLWGPTGLWFPQNRGSAIIGPRIGPSF